MIRVIFCLIPVLMIAAICRGFAGNAPVCHLSTVTVSDSLAVVEVKVSNFKNIGACDLKIGFDHNIAEFQKISFGTGVSFAAFDLNNVLINEGIIRCGGYFNKGVTLTDGSVFLKLHFKKRKEGTTQLFFIDDDESHGCHFYDGEINPLNDTPSSDFYINGSLTFLAPGISPVSQIMPVNACKGENVVVPVMVKGFENVGMAELSIVYDSSLLSDPVLIDNSNVLSLTATFPDQGVINITGLSLDKEGVSLPDDALLFSISFSYSGGTALVEFNQTSQMICQYYSPFPEFRPLLANPREQFFISGEINQSDYSNYQIEVTISEKICDGQTGDILILVANEIPPGVCDHYPLALRIEAEGPGDVIFSFLESGAERHEFKNSGNLEIYSGSVLPPEFNQSIEADFEISVPGEYLFSFWLEDENSNTLFEKISSQVTLFPLPQPQISGDNNVCAFSGDNLYFTEKGMASYQWVVSGGEIISGGGENDHSVRVLWKEEGNGYVSVTYSSAFTGCFSTEPGTMNVKIDPCGVSVSGNVSYPDQSLTPLKDVSLFLTSGNDTVYSAVSDQNGEYRFPSVMPGIYRVQASFPFSDAEVINSIDAGLLSRWLTFDPEPLEMVRFRAGDVDGNHSLSMDDALMINAFFLSGGDPSWSDPPGKWCLWKSDERVDELLVKNEFLPLIDVGYQPLIQNFQALLTGDFNRGYFPEEREGKPAAGSLSFKEGKVVNALPGEERVLSVNVNSDLKIGAFSLVVNFPGDMMEVLDIYAGKDQKNRVPYSFVNGHLRLGWFGIEPLVLKKGEPLFSVKVRISEIANAGKQLSLELIPGPLNELADEKMEVARYYELSPDSLRIVTVNTDSLAGNNSWYLKVFPVPADEYITICYQVPEKGSVTINISDPQGRVTEIPGITLTPGKNQFIIPVGGWSPGVYFIRLGYSNGYKNMLLKEKVLIWH